MFGTLCSGYKDAKEVDFVVGRRRGRTPRHQVGWDAGLTKPHCFLGLWAGILTY